MKQKHIDNIKLAAATCKNVLLNICEFNDILGEATGYGVKAVFDDWFDPITKRATLNTGYYANIYNAKIWCSYIAAPETIRISNNDITNVKDEAQWSSEIDLNNDFDPEQYR